MTKLSINNFIKVLKDDLDENLVQHARISEDTIINFFNPVTGTLDQIKITSNPCDSDEVGTIMYIIDAEGRDRSSPEPFMTLVCDLEDLYEWILIEDMEDAV